MADYLMNDNNDDDPSTQLLKELHQAVSPQRTPEPVERVLTSGEREVDFHFGHQDNCCGSPGASTPAGSHADETFHEDLPEEDGDDNADVDGDVDVDVEANVRNAEDGDEDEEKDIGADAQDAEASEMEEDELDEEVDDDKEANSTNGESEDDVEESDNTARTDESDIEVSSIRYANNNNTKRVNGHRQDEMDISNDDAHDSDVNIEAQSDNDSHNENNDIEAELVRAQKAHTALHKKAKGLIPHILPPTRYWVAILHHNILPKDARKEKDFLWIKANRINTVETIWHTYQNATTEDTFQLLIHNENPEFEDVLEELDFYDDKLVVFRALVKAGGNEEQPIVIDDE